MTLDFTRQTVLVTGASRGIGRACALAFGAAGARVGVHYGRSRAEADALAGALGNGSQAFGADLADPPAAQALWDDVLAAWGRMDVLVCNAGVFREAPPEAPLDAWLAAWDETLAVNLTSAAVLVRAACLHAQARKARGEVPVRGEALVRIVTVSSRAAFRGDDPAYLAYAASKGGLVALTKSVARGFGGDGVAAFGVAPGFTATDMAAPYVAAHGEAAAAAGTAFGTLARPDDVAPAVLFLASGLADHATGTTLDVNGASYVR